MAHDSAVFIADRSCTAPIGVMVCPSDGIGKFAHDERLQGAKQPG
jgi:hypothetical protein